MSYIDQNRNQIDIYITKQDLRDHLGLRTNVTTKTRAKWLAENISAEGQPDVLQTQSAREMVADHHAKMKKLQPV